jgi:hypothetical protein
MEAKAKDTVSNINSARDKRPSTLEPLRNQQPKPQPGVIITQISPRLLDMNNFIGNRHAIKQAMTPQGKLFSPTTSTVLKVEDLTE